MKTLTTIALAALIAATPALAVDAHHPEQAAGEAAAPAGGEKTEATIEKLQDNTARLQTQLEGLAKAQTDEERRQLLAEHIKTMQEGMDMARGMQADMMGCPMMAGGQKGGDMKGGGMMGGGMMGSGMMGGGSGDGLRQMEKRMDMMQMMMEQMMRRLDERQPPMPAR